MLGGKSQVKSFKKSIKKVVSFVVIGYPNPHIRTNKSSLKFDQFSRRTDRWMMDTSLSFKPDSNNLILFT